MTLAIEGGTPVRQKPWPDWPPPLTAEQRSLLLQVAESGQWGATHGRIGEELAARFASYCETSHAVPMTNGTIALFVALRALGVGPGDEVIIPAYTFVACATAVTLAGATPVIIDVHPDHLHLDASAVAQAIGPRTAAVMPVHLAGSPVDMDPLLRLASSHGLSVVEDCAQAHGARYRGRAVGGLGHVGTFSFQSSKAMTAGEGGMLVCQDEALADRLWSLCNVGRRRGGEWYEHPVVGWNLRLTELQAALLLPWLDRLDDEISRREEFCRRVSAALAPGDLGVTVIPQPPGTTTDSRHLLMLRVSGQADRFADRFMAAMNAEGVPLGRGYPPLGELGAVASGGALVLGCPNATAASAEVLWLRQPMLMDPEDADDVVEAIAKVAKAMPGLNS